MFSIILTFHYFGKGDDCSSLFRFLLKQRGLLLRPDRLGNTEPASPVAGSVLGGLLRGLSAHFSPFQLVTTLSDRVGGSVQTGESWGVTRLVRFPRFRTVVIPVPLVVRSVQVRNSRKRTNYALFAGQPLAGALLRLRTTVNMIRMDPMFFATGKTPQTCALV